MAEHAGTHIDSPKHVVESEEVAKRNPSIDKVCKKEMLWYYARPIGASSQARW